MSKHYFEDDAQALLEGGMKGAAASAGEGIVSNIDPDSDEARLARHRAACRTVHQDVSAARRAAADLIHQQREEAIEHLVKMLGCRAAHEQYAADLAAREWLASIGR